MPLKVVEKVKELAHMQERNLTLYGIPKETGEDIKGTYWSGSPTGEGHVAVAKVETFLRLQGFGHNYKLTNADLSKYANADFSITVGLNSISKTLN